MTDSVDRLYNAIVAARDLDPSTSRTARLLQRGQAKMAQKLAEEAIEVVIDAMQGNSDAVVRESADLIYNLAVLWSAAGVRPQDVWDEMNRRERLFGMAEKLPKSNPKKSSPAKPGGSVPLPGEAKPAAALAIAHPVIELETRRSPKRR
jgi:phosphoribosyl-ATP pyrophosphohydrolase